MPERRVNYETAAFPVAMPCKGTHSPMSPTPTASRLPALRAWATPAHVLVTVVAILAVATGAAWAMPNSAPTPIDTTASDTIAISGRVTLSDGSPVAGARVEIFLPSGRTPSGNWMYISYHDTRADAAGHYLVKWVEDEVPPAPIGVAATVTGKPAVRTTVSVRPGQPATVDLKIS